MSQRTIEFGIRIALGAAPRTVPWLVLRQRLLLAVNGMGYGVAGSLGLLVTTVPSYVPALRAEKADPVVALRCQ